VVVLEELRRYRLPAPSNWERFSSPAVDALLNQYGSTTSSATQHSIIDKLQTIMVHSCRSSGLGRGRLVPVNLMSTPASRRQRTPTRSPAVHVPDWGVVVLHLKPKSNQLSV